MNIEFTSLIKMMEAIPNEDAAIAYFRAIRWKHGEFCPHCGADKLYHFEGGRKFKCAAPECRQKFSLRVGTVFEDSKVEIRKWLYAIWIITNHPKGIASTTLSRDIGVTQKTAWFMMHRLRHAARTQSFNRQLGGIVEADESFFGGKDKNKHANKRGKDKKVVVFGMLERGGELRAHPVESLKDVKSEIIAHVKPGAILMTDEWAGYSRFNKRFWHASVNHSAGEYSANGYVHVNGMESAWALIKRQIYGIHHFVSPKHLHRYISEATWRYNRRTVATGGRVAEMISRLDGRLTYKALIA
jgi:transposase-like protein